jgi:hypothetical protein
MSEYLRFSELLQRISYKQNVTLSAWIDRSDIPMGLEKVYLVIEMKVPDSRGSGREKPIGGKYPVPYGLMIEHNEEQMVRWIKMMIRSAEFHEIDEWLRLDGELIDDPHKKEHAR